YRTFIASVILARRFIQTFIITGGHSEALAITENQVNERNEALAMIATPCPNAPIMSPCEPGPCDHLSPHSGSPANGHPSACVGTEAKPSSPRSHRRHRWP